MKDSWVTDTLIQEATLAMELPASPASQFNHTSAKLPANDKSSDVESVHEKPLDNGKQEDCHSQRKHEQTANTSCSKEKKESEWCSRGIAVFMPASPTGVSKPNQSPQCNNQPMDISESIECVDDEEQIVPQSVASCEMPRRNAPDEQMAMEDEPSSVQSRIMKMGLKDLLNEVDPERGLKESRKKSMSSNQILLSTNTSTSFPYQNQRFAHLWHGPPRQGHKIFGPLARPVSPSTGSPITTGAQSVSSVPQNKIHIRERPGSPIITHKKFDYQKKLLSNASTPLNLCKRSPTHRETSHSVVIDEFTPMDLTTKKPNGSDNVQCSSIQNPVGKADTLFASNKNHELFLGKARSHFLFGAKPELDHYNQPRLSSFFLPRSPSCSPLSSSSEHSSSSTVSTIDQKSEPESSTTTSDVKPTAEMLSRASSNISMAPPTLGLIDRENHTMPKVQPFDPARLNEFYLQQFMTKIEGGVYQVPAAHCLGYTTTVCPPQPSSPSKSGASKPDKMFICQECGAIFKHRHHVVRHMRSHSGERPFQCDECGATFARKCILTNHKRTHTGEKPYICTECGDTFSRKHHLVIHRRTHTGEKPYKCAHCGAAFARSHHLNRHRKTHIKMDALAPEGTNGMFFPQVPGTLPLQGMQGLPTMLPLLPTAFISGSTPQDTQENTHKQTQDQAAASEGKIREENKAELERGDELEVSERSTADDKLGATNPASLKNESDTD